MSKTNKGYVYFISNSNYIKIGFSKDPNKRLKQLQTASSDKLEILYTIDNCTKDTESYLHKYFSKQYCKSGEWYDYDMVLDWIKRHKLELQAQKEMGYI